MINISGVLSDVSQTLSAKRFFLVKLSSKCFFFVGDFLPKVKTIKNLSLIELYSQCIDRPGVSVRGRRLHK